MNLMPKRLRLRHLVCLTLLFLTPYSNASATDPPAGSISATPNPCTNLPGADFCTPTLFWSSSDLPSYMSKVQIRVGDQIVHCDDGNASGSHFPAGVEVKKSGTTFTLFAASDCSQHPFHRLRLAEVFARNNEPQGRIWAVDNPCVIPEGATGCKPVIHWDSLNLRSLGGGSSNVIVGLGNTKFACGDANTAGSKPITGFQIGANPKTFSLYAASSCQDTTWPGTTPLATVEVSSYPTGTPVCSVTGEAMAEVGPDYLGIIENARRWFQGPLYKVADSLGAAEVRFLRRTVKWQLLQPSEHLAPADWNWPEYENLFDLFAAPGVEIEPWVTLSHSPTWAVDTAATGCNLSVSSGSPNDCHRYPAENISDWRLFVRETVRRLGSTYGIRNWEVWQEPDSNAFLGSSQDYVQLLNVAHEEIQAASQDLGIPMTLWAANSDFWNAGQREAKFLDLALEVLANGDFDAYAIHIFLPQPERLIHSFEYTRHLLDAMGHADKEIAVTAGGNGDCTIWDDWSPAERAAFFSDFYVCLANAGAAHTLWFQSTDRPNQTCDGAAWVETRGVMETVLGTGGGIVDYLEKPEMYPALKALGTYLNQP